jgi:hypothetical protein
MDFCLPFKFIANKFINFVLQKDIIRVNHFGHEYDIDMQDQRFPWRLSPTASSYIEIKIE